MRLLPLTIFSLLGPTIAEWRLSDSQQSAFQIQRDIAGAIPVDQITSYGVSLSPLVFSGEGYTTSALTQVSRILKAQAGILWVDLYWNEEVQTWQLCPGPFTSEQTNTMTKAVKVDWEGETYVCEPGLTPAQLMLTFALYILSTNVAQDANIVTIVLNLRTIECSGTDGGNDSGNDSGSLTESAGGMRSSLSEDSSPMSTFNASLNSTSTSNHSFSAINITSTAATTSANSSATASPNSGNSTSNFSSAYLNQRNSSLTDIIAPISKYLFTPLDLPPYTDNGVSSNSSAYSSIFPTQTEFLFSLYKRTMVVVALQDLGDSANAYVLLSFDTDTFFFHNSTVEQLTSDYPCSQSSSNVLELHLFVNSTRFRIAEDYSALVPAAVIHQWAQCGFSPVLALNAILDMVSNSLTNSLTALLAALGLSIPNMFWSWAPGQPKTKTDSEIDDENSDDESSAWEDTNSALVAQQCVLITSEGWMVDNCYNRYRLACRNDNDPFQWKISHDLHIYGNAASDGTCPDNYTFAVPRLSVEQRALLAYLASLNDTYPTWIDINDIMVPGCFVTGGAYSQCPYKEVLSPLNLARRISPSALIALVIVLLIWYERFIRFTPIYSHRKRHWKKVVELSRDQDYEGVPS